MIHYEHTNHLTDKFIISNLAIRYKYIKCPNSSPLPQSGESEKLVPTQSVSQSIRINTLPCGYWQGSKDAKSASGKGMSFPIIAKRTK